MEIYQFLLCVTLCASSLMLAFGQQQSDCGEYMELSAGQSVTYKNPGFPYFAYPLNTECQWTISAPSFHRIECVAQLDIDNNGKYCGESDRFRYCVDGTRNLSKSNAIGVCGRYDSYRFMSSFNMVTFGFISKYYSGRFQCTCRAVAETSCTCGTRPITRITGGERLAPNMLPCMAALLSRETGDLICGASLISSRAVLTAAHCVSYEERNTRKLLLRPTNSILISVGRDDISKREADDTAYSYNYGCEQIILHPNYNSGGDNDIAVLRTDRHIAWSKGVTACCLPNINDPIDKYDSKWLMLAGWGTTELAGPLSPVLLTASVQGISNKICSSRSPDSNIQPNMLCTVSVLGRDACQRDSGSPILYYDTSIKRDFVVGVVSFGRGCGTTEPGIGTRVAVFNQWIKAAAGTGNYFCQY